MGPSEWDDDDDVDDDDDDDDDVEDDIDDNDNDEGSGRLGVHLDGMMMLTMMVMVTTMI